MLQGKLKGAVASNRQVSVAIPASYAIKVARSTRASACQDANRRAVLLGAPVLLAGMAALPIAPSWADDAAGVVQAAAPSSAGKMAELYDPILAYRFSYPVQTISGKPLKMLLAHEPEKYSSAAPLTADARQRIVSELLDLNNFTTVSMTVGPISGVLKEIGAEEWKPLDVALTVLIDRSTSRVSTGQRVAMNDVEEAHIEDRNGRRFYVYEHQSQGSPTPSNRKRETYRHALAVTTIRPASDGTPFLYTLNLSCSQDLWFDLLPLFQEAIQSFTMVEPTEEYVPPDVNSWQFW